MNSAYLSPGMSFKISPASAATTATTSTRLRHSHQSHTSISLTPVSTSDKHQHQYQPDSSIKVTTSNNLNVVTSLVTSTHYMKSRPVASTTIPCTILAPRTDVHIHTFGCSDLDLFWENGKFETEMDAWHGQIGVFSFWGHLRRLQISKKWL
jgi:hypothetical protein